MLTMFKDININYFLKGIAHLKENRNLTEHFGNQN